MGTHRPMASLSPTLLARKGQARPAMRPAGLASLSALANAGDDLGWNDMGDEPAPAPEPLPPVLVERRRLSADLTPRAEEAPLPLEPQAEVQPEAEAEPAPSPVAPAAPQVPVATPRLSAADVRRAAFTLRLDAERHLLLRLAAAARGQSGQRLVTEALDAFLATLPEVAALRAQLAGATMPDDRGE